MYQDSTFTTNLQVSADPKYNGVKENALNNNIVRVYPNPTSDILSISVALNGKSNINVSVYDISGKMISTLCNQTVFNSGMFNKEFDIKSTLTNGNYIVVTKVNDIKYFKKVVVL